MASTKTTRPRRQKADSSTAQDPRHDVAEDHETAGLRMLAKSHARICGMIVEVLAATKASQMTANVALVIGRVTINIHSGSLESTQLSDEGSSWISSAQMMEEGAALYSAGFIRREQDNQSSGSSTSGDQPEDNR